MSPHWYETFFDGVVLDMWVRISPAAQTVDEVDYVLGALGVVAGDRVLDVPCGHGRHACELTRRGYRVTGVDLSSASLARARQTAVRDQLEVEWLRRDMRELPSGAMFDGAVCLGNSFGYLDHDGNVACLEAIHRVLRPGGRLVLDTGMIAESVLPKIQERTWMPHGDLLFLIDNDYQASTSRLDTTFTFVRDGVVDRRAASHQIYTVAELCRLLKSVGLSPTGLHGSTSGEPFEFGSPRLWLTAEKD